MKSKILIAIPLLFISINLTYSIINDFFIKIPYENGLLIVNSIFMIILMVTYYNQTKKDLFDSLDSNALIHTNITNDSFQINAQMLINHFSDFLCIKDKEGRWLGASETYLKLFNLQDISYIGKTDAELFHYSNSNVDILKVGFIQDKSAWHLKKPVKETRVVVLYQQKKTLEITRIPIFDNRKNELKLILTGHFVNLDDKKKNQLELLPKAFESCHLNFMFLDKDFHIAEVNNALSLLTGYSSNELTGKPLSFIIKGKLTQLQSDFFTNNKQFWSSELKCLTKNGRDFPIKLEISKIIKNSSTFYFSSLLDITQQKQAERHIIKLSYYDELTGLINRSMFYDKLRKFISSVKVDNSHCIVFVIDLDRFKVINESLGHDAGNELLREVAIRLQELIGSNDIAARLSGDEFAILMLSNKTYEETVYTATIVAGKISQKLSEVIYVRSHEAFIGSSIGISIYPEDCRVTEPMLKAETLLKNADIARNNAKTQGKNNYQFYNRDYTSTPKDKLLMELNLRKAITKDELKLYYQPQYDIRGRNLCGAEVLVRWLPINEKMITPDQFITLAEDTGLIIEIGYWILRTACFQLQAWLNDGYPLQQVSVNVSVPQFNDPNFIASVQKALTESQLSPEHLELEITESMLIGDARFIDFQLKKLQQMGIKLALDDFGTGYSSLSYLKSFPIDVLKMDKSFIDKNKAMPPDSKDSKIACAIIGIGHSLEQKVIAEGVESQEQFDFLRTRGCDIIQGFLYSKPLSAEDMKEFLTTGLTKFNPKPEKNNPFE